MVRIQIIPSSSMAVLWNLIDILFQHRSHMGIQLVSRAETKQSRRLDAYSMAMTSCWRRGSSPIGARCPFRQDARPVGRFARQGESLARARHGLNERSRLPSTLAKASRRESSVASPISISHYAIGRTKRCPSLPVWPVVTPGRVLTSPVIASGLNAVIPS